MFLHDGPPGKAEAQRAKVRAVSRSVATSRFARAELAVANPGPGTTIPYWSTSITSPLDGQTYQYSMVGSSPYLAHPDNSKVTYVPIVVRAIFTSGGVAVSINSIPEPATLALLSLGIVCIAGRQYRRRV